MKTVAVTVALVLLAGNLACSLWLIGSARQQECLTRHVVLTNARQAPYNGRVVIPGTEGGAQPLMLDATWRVQCDRRLR